ncbi:maltokinase N-terminal cap-like domain-containing protein [Kitasatospora sp. NPDC004240]
MAVIHHTTLRPTKGELLTAWLPGRAWYRGDGQEPRLERAGGFRLDDPEGEVGIEFMVVTDTAGAGPVTYLTPLTYRGAPLEGAEHALVGTMEHGVLGRRWVYDGAHDPVLVAQLLALLGGEVRAQAQSESDTPDPEVTVALGEDVQVPAPQDFAPAVDGAAGTRLPGLNGPQAPALHLTRVLDGPPAARPADATGPESRRCVGSVTGHWTRPDGTPGRGPFAVLRTDHP